MTHQIGMVVFDGVQLLDVAGPVDVFAAANKFGADYAVRLIGWDRCTIWTSSGVGLLAEVTADAAEPVQTLIVTGGDDLARLPDPAADPARLGRLADAADRIASVCTGAFVLARAGLLDGEPATTHWRHAAALAAQFPAASVTADAIFTQSGRVMTSAGVSAGIDLALAMVEADHGVLVTRSVARELVVFMQRPGGQSQFSVRNELPPVQDPRLRRALDAITTAPAAEHRLVDLAAAASMTPRHFRRLCQRELGAAPSKVLESIRLEAARGFLERGSSVAEATRSSGFGSDQALRRAFRAEYGVSPSAYRKRFRAMGPPGAQ